MNGSAPGFPGIIRKGDDLVDTPNVVQVSFRRKFNLGNYETMDVELVATIAPDQDPQKILKLLDHATMEYRRARED